MNPNKKLAASIAFVAGGGLQICRGRFLEAQKDLTVRERSSPIVTRRRRRANCNNLSPSSHADHAVMSSNGAVSTNRPLPIESWMEMSSAVLHPSVSVQPSDGRAKIGLHVSHLSAAKLLKGTELLTLPEDMFLSSGTARSTLEKDCGALQVHERDIAPASWLALQVLFERSKGARSKFASFLETLPCPGELDSAPLWNPVELEWLRGSPVFDRAVEIAKGVESEWTNLQDGVIPKLFNDPYTECSLELYRWAVAVVDARGASVGQKGELVLAPIVHQLAPAAKAPSARLEMGSSGMVFNAKPCLRLVTLRDIEPGEELTVAYSEGRTRNADLLLERGLALSVKGANTVDVEFSVTSLDQFFEDKADILEQYGEDAGEEIQAQAGIVRAFEFVAGEYSTEREELGAAWHPPEEMESFLRLTCLGGPDAFLLEGIFRGEIWDHLGFPISRENEDAVCSTVIGACEDALEGYTLSEEHAEAEGLDESGKARFELAKAIVKGERGVLKRAADAYRRRARSLDAMEYYAERRLNALDLLRPVDENEIVDSESGARLGRAFDENYY